MTDEPTDLVKRRQYILESQQLARFEVELQALRKKERTVGAKLEAFRYMLKGIQSEILEIKGKMK